MRYALRLEISYDFDLPAGAGRNLLRVIPAELAGRQRLISADLRCHPRPAEQRRFRDFYGFDTCEAVFRAGAEALRFRLEAEVECLAQPDLPDRSPPLKGLVEQIAQIRSLQADAPHHYLAPSPRIPFPPEITRFASEAMTGAATTRAAIEALGQALHGMMRFDPVATEVDTPIAEAFAGRHGVCQDFSQIMIAGLRAQGIPAGYVSGYLRTLPPPGQARLEGADAMHAWVRAWAGVAEGWVEYDPTNRCFAGTDHVVVGYGRDYLDAAPVTGVVRLGGSQRTRQRVDLLEI